MEFTFETAYDQRATTVMAKAIRKTVRKKRSRRSHVFGIIVIILALFLTLPVGGEEFVFDFRVGVTWFVTAILVLVMLFEDKINGYVTKKRMLPGLDKATVTFREDGYHSETAIGSSEFNYSTVILIAETADFFVFVFSQNHAQIYDKHSITGGTVEEFREFIKTVTGKEIQDV